MAAVCFDSFMIGESVFCAEKRERYGGGIVEHLLSDCYCDTWLDTNFIVATTELCLRLLANIKYCTQKHYVASNLYRKILNF